VGDVVISAQEVFLTAMTLMDEESEDGQFSGYPDEYKKKSWSLLTLLQAELVSGSDSTTSIVSESSLFQIDDRTARTVLPYGLAAHLLMNEDQNRAAFFNARYDELKRKRPAIISKIVDVYSTPVEEENENETNDRVIDGGEF
jgi:hypothetical protein